MFREPLKIEDFPAAFVGWLHKCLELGQVTVKVQCGNGRGRQLELLQEFFAKAERGMPEDFGSTSTAFGLTITTTLPTPHFVEQFPEKGTFTLRGQFMEISNKMLGAYALKLGAVLEYPRDNTKTLLLAGQQSFFA